MKLSFVIIAILLSSVLGQELILDSIRNAYSSGAAVSKTYQGSDWGSITDFAIYGWFKIDSSYARTDWATGFHFTSNTNAKWTDCDSNGDRVLMFQYSNDQLHNPTYSTTRQKTNYYENQTIKSGDLNKWAFMYVTYGHKQQAQYAYYKLASSGEIGKKITSINHYTSTFYQIMVGGSFKYKYFPGDIWRLTLLTGINAYRESSYFFVTNTRPDVSPSCPIIFDMCAQAGNAVNVCQNLPKYDVTTIKSIYLPSGYTMTIYDTNNFAGKKITYNKSIECITSLNWAMLVSTNAITVEDDDRATSLRRQTKKTNKK